jgi:hypothetical protein
MVVCNVAYNVVWQLADWQVIGGSTGGPSHLTPVDVDQKRQRLAPECIEGDMRWPSAYGVARSVKMLGKRWDHGWSVSPPNKLFAAS